MSKVIGTLGNVDSLSFAGRTFIDEPIVLTGIVSGATNTTFRLMGATAGYAVTAGKVLTIKAIKIYSLDSTQQSYFFSQSDNDVGSSSGTSPSSPLYLFGSSAGNIKQSATIGAITELACSFAVASGKYFSVTGSGGGAGAQIIVIGTEA